MRNRLNSQIRKCNYLIGEIDKVYHEAALKLGLSDSAMSILYTICGEGRPCLLSEICRLSGISKQTVNSALRKLEAEHIISSEYVDGKQKIASLTEKGQRLAEDTVSKLIKAENKVFDEWSKEERQEYLRLMQDYLEKMKTEIDNF